MRATEGSTGEVLRMCGRRHASAPRTPSFVGPVRIHGLAHARPALGAYVTRLNHGHRGFHRLTAESFASIRTATTRGEVSRACRL